MITSFIAVVRIALLVFDIHTEFEFYGLNAKENVPFNGIIVFIVFILHGFTGYSFWFERDYAINVGFIDALLGFALCFFSMIISFNNGTFTARLEVILLTLFFIKLLNIRYKWIGMQRLL